MKTIKFLTIAAMAAGTMVLSGCKDDVEPGTEPSDVTGLFINEVSSNKSDDADWIEFYNSTDAEIDLSGYHVQDDKGTDEEYTFPGGSKIAAGGFLVITSSKDSAEGGDFSFGISSGGDKIVLLDEAYAIIDQVTVPALETGCTYARTEDGGSAWESVTGGTKGRSNTSETDKGEETDDPTDNPDDNPADDPSDKPAIDFSVIRLNEINGNDKFIELYNMSETDVDIEGVYFTREDEVGETETVYTAAAGTIIKAHGYLTVWSKKAAEDNPDLSPVFDSGLSADKALKIELYDPEGKSLDVFRNPLKTEGEEAGVYDSSEGSFARETDGTGDWYIMAATQGTTNNGAAKVSEDKVVWE